MGQWLPNTFFFFVHSYSYACLSYGLVTSSLAEGYIGAVHGAEIGFTTLEHSLENHIQHIISKCDNFILYFCFGFLKHMKAFSTVTLYEGV